MEKCIICNSDAVISNNFLVMEQVDRLRGSQDVKHQRVAGVVRSSLCPICVDRLSQQKSNKKYNKLIKKGKEQRANNLLLVSALKFMQDTSLGESKKPSGWWEIQQGDDYYIPRFIPSQCVIYNVEDEKVGAIYHKFPTGGSVFYYLRKNKMNGLIVGATEDDNPGFFSCPSDIILLPGIDAQLKELANQFIV